MSLLNNDGNDSFRTDSAPASSGGLILLTLAGLQFINLVDFMIVMPLGPQLQADLGIRAHQFGWIVSSYTLAAGIAGFFAAAWLDRLPRKGAYIVLSLGLIAGTAACGLATSYPFLLATRCITGGFGGVHGALALAIVADVFPTERRGHANSMLMLAIGVASVAGVPLGIAVGTAFGWAMPFYLLALAGLLLDVLKRDTLGAQFVREELQGLSSPDVVQASHQITETTSERLRRLHRAPLEHRLSCDALRTTILEHVASVANLCFGECTNLLCRLVDLSYQIKSGPLNLHVVTEKS